MTAVYTQVYATNFRAGDTLYKTRPDVTGDLYGRVDGKGYVIIRAASDEYS